MPHPDSADKWLSRWSLSQSTAGSERQKKRSSLLPPAIWTVNETCPVQLETCRHSTTHKNSVRPKAAPKIFSPSIAKCEKKRCDRKGVATKNTPGLLHGSNVMTLLHISISNVHLVFLRLSQVNKTNETDCTAEWIRWPSAVPQRCRTWKLNDIKPPVAACAEHGVADTVVRRETKLVERYTVCTTSQWFKTRNKCILS